MVYLYVVWYVTIIACVHSSLTRIYSYNAFVDLNQFTIATEVFPTHVRNQGSAIAISGLFLADILWLNLLPTATASIGWKYYLVFVCLCVVHTIHIFFKLPDVSTRLCPQCLEQ